MADDAWDERGSEKPVEKTVVKYEIPAQTKKGQRQEIAERLPDYKSGQDQKKEIDGNEPMKENLPGMVFGRKWVGPGEAEEVLKDGQYPPCLRSIDGHRIGASGEETLIGDVEGKGCHEKRCSPTVPEKPGKGRVFEGKESLIGIDHPAGENEDDDRCGIGPVIDPLKKGVPLEQFFLRILREILLSEVFRGMRLAKGPSAGVDGAEDQAGDDEGPEDSVVEPVKVILGHGELWQGKWFTCHDGFRERPLFSKSSAMSFKSSRCNVALVGMPVLASHPISR